MTLLPDQPQRVRAGESFDLPPLRAYLARDLPDFDGGELSLRQFPSGHSNLTYLLSSDRGQSWVLRRPPFGHKAQTAHDMGREARVLRALAAVGFTRAPRALLSCDDPSVIGSPFFLMERAEGVILRPNPAPPPPFDEPTMRGVCHAFLQNLVDLHSLDPFHPALADLGHPAGYIRRQVEGWSKRYTLSSTHDLPDMTRAAAWLLDHLPPSAPPPAALIHNDYKYDNLLLSPQDPTEITATLDWEMATIGDPLADLGTALAYWLDPDDPPSMHRLPFNHTTTPGNLSRAGLVERYCMLTSAHGDHIVFYYVLALFKVATIAQQIFKRFSDGATSDPRFASLAFAVRAIASQAALAIDRQRIDRLG
jgi:aminoglycoside phosphotransferase (APT) family kinase protein